MTRKQALIRVYEYLRQHEENKEFIEIQQKLQEIILDMPLTGWSEATIFDTLNQWIYEHGRIPTTKDMSQKGLPPISVIQNRFGLKGKEFLDIYYPRKQPKCNSVRYGDKNKDEWCEIFKSEFLRIKPCSAVEFNKKRKHNLPTWSTFAKLFNLSNWLQLLNYCEFVPISKEKLVYNRESKPLKVSSHIDIIQRINEIENGKS